MAFAGLADSALWLDDSPGNCSLNASLFAEIDEEMDRPTADAGRAIFCNVTGWFRRGGGGKRVLWSLLSGRIRHGAALADGLRFLECFDVDEQKSLLRLLLTQTLQPPIDNTRIFLRGVGQHIGWAALMRYENTGAKTGSFDVYGELLTNRPAEGILRDTACYFHFVGQSIFGAKKALVGGGIPLGRADEFAARMQACWAVLGPSLGDTEYEDKPPFALWVFGPILGSNRHESLAFASTLDERKAWWLALRPLALSIVREGPSKEINSLLRGIKDSPLLASMGSRDVDDIFQSLHDRTKSLIRDSTGFSWDDSIECASVAIEAILARTANAKERADLYAVVESWAAPPLVNEHAAAAARRIRM
jgi:hypothetical protein